VTSRSPRPIVAAMICYVLSRQPGMRSCCGHEFHRGIQAVRVLWKARREEGGVGDRQEGCDQAPSPGISWLPRTSPHCPDSRRRGSAGAYFGTRGAAGKEGGEGYGLVEKMWIRRTDHWPDQAHPQASQGRYVLLCGLLATEQEILKAGKAAFLWWCLSSRAQASKRRVPSIRVVQLQ